jgi:D-alanine--D-alanine ligase
LAQREKLRVAVLMGGDSAEREISLKTGAQVMDALDASRYDAFSVDAADLKRLPGDALTALASADVVFIALHGPGGEDGAIQGFLEWMGLPYTGSGVAASAVAMDKALCKRVLRDAGVSVPRSRLVTRETAEGVAGEIAPPLVVKPNRQGSSFGMTIVHDAALLPEAVALALRYDDACLLEEFVDGTEITVAALGNGCPRILPAIEIVPTGEFYDFASKYEEGGSRHIIPARISAAAARTAADYARRCHETLGCRGMSRTDMMVRGDEVTVLEINTIPGMTRTSLLPDAAAAAGIPFAALLDGLIADARTP